MGIENCSYQVIPVSPGIAIGRVMRIHHSHITEAPECIHIEPDDIPTELERFNRALTAARVQIQALQQQLHTSVKGDSSEIFDAHLLMLDDKIWLNEVKKLITSGPCNAEFALFEATEHFAQTLSAIPDAYLQERVADFRDISERVMSHLGDTSVETVAYADRRIVIASNLTPSETVGLNRDRVLGFAVETGSTTSHTAILARSLKIPAVVGVPPDLLANLTAADKLIVDGFTGKIIVNPDARAEEAYRLKAKAAGELFNKLQQDNFLPPQTTDGFVVKLAANIDAGQNYEEVRTTGAYGIGLFRTEFLFMDSEHIPNEDEQFAIYKKLLVDADNDPVTIRTMDIGGDKLNNGILRAVEQNPFLGLRGIRLCLRERRDLFEIQLRALLRAGVHGNLRVMLPMVSSVIEIDETLKIISEMRTQLEAEGKTCVPKLILGVMIETPAAALMADCFAEKVDFFSLGTNDLIQYTMAVDRSNERVAHLYRPSHPAILQLIKKTVEAANRHRIFVSVCGQMAEDPKLTPLLVGLGVHELSMPTGALGVVRRILRRVSLHDCEKLVEHSLNCSNAAEALELSMRVLQEKAPEIMGI